MLRKIRQTLAVLFFTAITLLFLTSPEQSIGGLDGRLKFNSCQRCWL